MRAILAMVLLFASERPVPEFTTGFRFAGFADVSTDGKMLSLVKSGRLSVRGVESTEEKELLPTGSVHSALGGWSHWSPDGKTIYYLQQNGKPGQNDLWSVDIASGKQRLLIKDAGGVSEAAPSPSPDGKSLAFYHGTSLMLADVDGRNERILCKDEESGRNMVWSPDSTQILLAPHPIDGTGRLTLVDAATGQLKILKQSSANVMTTIWPRWSSGPILLSRWGWQIMHLNLPDEKLTYISNTPGVFYSDLVGTGPDEYSIVVQKMRPPPSTLDNLLSGFLQLGITWYKPPKFQSSWILTLSNRR